MSRQEIIIDKNMAGFHKEIVSQYHPDKVFILTDENTHSLCMPRLLYHIIENQYNEIIILAGDCSKNIEQLSKVWSCLSEKGATRKSLLINLGGGVVCDLGGFAAATFKRGIRFINIPTTLLSIVDAAVGGKTGINYHGLKNEVGAFSFAEEVRININFLKTLPDELLLSGFAEMLKHGIIADKDYFIRLQQWDIAHKDWDMLELLVKSSIHIKQQIVENDPHEQSIRKALNFGHTVGHAFESWIMKQGRELQHGYAVAYGMICELYLSHCILGFPTDSLRMICHYLKDLYGSIYFTCNDYVDIYHYMLHDKKNISRNICFTLLKEIGQPVTDRIVDKKTIFEMFDFYRESMGF